MCAYHAAEQLGQQRLSLRAGRTLTRLEVVCRQKIVHIKEDGGAGQEGGETTLDDSHLVLRMCPLMREKKVVTLRILWWQQCHR